MIRIPDIQSLRRDESDIKDEAKAIFVAVADDVMTSEDEDDVIRTEPPSSRRSGFSDSGSDDVRC